MAESLRARLSKQESLTQPLHNVCSFCASIPHLVLQVPHTVLVSELLIAGAALWQDAALKATHVEEQVGVVFAVHGNKAVLPLDSRH